MSKVDYYKWKKSKYNMKLNHRRKQQHFNIKRYKTQAVDFPTLQTPTTSKAIILNIIEKYTPKTVIIFKKLYFLENTMLK